MTKRQALAEFSESIDCGYGIMPSYEAWQMAIEALMKLIQIEEKEPLHYNDRESLCDEDISYEQGFNDCLRWAKLPS